MFDGCISLIAAPELSATILAGCCYNEMFLNCTSLTKAPVLPALTLTEHCYYNMFNGCTHLNYIKMLATDISADCCLMYWVSNVAPIGTFIKNKDAIWDEIGEHGVPEGWTIKTMNDEQLYIEALESGDITFSIPESLSSIISMQYSINSSEWYNCEFNNNKFTYSLNSGDVINFKGNNEYISNENNYSNFSSTCNFNIGGNIMSLLNYNESLTDYAFNGLFQNCTKLISASDLILPIQLSVGCY